MSHDIFSWKNLGHGPKEIENHWCKHIIYILYIHEEKSEHL